MRQKNITSSPVISSLPKSLFYSVPTETHLWLLKHILNLLKLTRLSYNKRITNNKHRFRSSRSTYRILWWQGERDSKSSGTTGRVELRVEWTRDRSSIRSQGDDVEWRVEWDRREGQRRRGRRNIYSVRGGASVTRERGGRGANAGGAEGGPMTPDGVGRDQAGPEQHRGLGKLYRLTTMLQFTSHIHQFTTKLIK